MSEQVVSLTNRKKIPMGLPNGQGGQVNLGPGETKLVRGDFEHYRRMPAQGMNGLVVKLVEGKSRLVEAEKTVDDVRMVTVTNHRNIPMQLATGLGQKHVNIGPRETSEPFLARVATVKQMTGITVRLVETKPTDEGEKPNTTDPSKPGFTGKVDGNVAALGTTGVVGAKAPAEESEKKEAAEDEVKRKEEAASTDAEVAAKAEQAAEDEAAAKKDADDNDPLAIRRRDLTLPATADEWAVHKGQMTWPDVRGICRELGIKTGSKDKKGLLKAITKKLYPKS